MKFLPGPLVAEARGSMGGTTAARNRFGQYLRTRAVPVNPRSNKQNVNRTRFSAATIAWFALTGAQRTAWNDYADAIPFSSAHLGTYFLTGQEMFLRTYTVMLAAGLTPVSDAPTILNLGDVDPTVALDTLSAATNTFNLTFNDSADWVSEDGAALQLAMCQPFSFSRSYNNGPYRNLAPIAGDSVGPETSPYSFTSTAVLGYPLTEGNQIRARCRIIRADGRVSSPFFTPFATIGA